MLVLQNSSAVLYVPWKKRHSMYLGINFWTAELFWTCEKLNFWLLVCEFCLAKSYLVDLESIIPICRPKSGKKLRFTYLHCEFIHSHTHKHKFLFFLASSFCIRISSFKATVMNLHYFRIFNPLHTFPCLDSTLNKQNTPWKKCDDNA